MNSFGRIGLLLAISAAGACQVVEGEAGVRSPDAEVVRAVSVVFRTDPDDRITILSDEGDRVLRVLAPGEGGFLRGALRPLVRERLRHGVDPSEPYDLSLHADGALILRDPPTGLHLDVAAFGPTSRAQFLTLLSLPTSPNGSMEDRP